MKCKLHKWFCLHILSICLRYAQLLSCSACLDIVFALSSLRLTLGHSTASIQLTSMGPLQLGSRDHNFLKIFYIMGYNL